MRLYHGTSAKYLDTILAEGVTPRGERPSNWMAVSAPDRVYLTTAYGAYFAQKARQSQEEDLLIVEIDADLLPDASRLQADEDAAVFAWASGDLPEEFAPPHGCVDIHDQAGHFSRLLDGLAEAGFGYARSLAMMGNCSHAGIVPPEAITSVHRYSAAEGPWWLAFHDPVISPLNFRFHGGEYRATQLVLAGRLEEALAIEHPFPSFLDLAEIAAMCERRRVAVPSAAFLDTERQPPGFV